MKTDVTRKGVKVDAGVCADCGTPLVAELTVKENVGEVYFDTTTCPHVREQLPNAARYLMAHPPQP